MSDPNFEQTSSAPAAPDDVSLRPPAFSEFHGQEKIKERLILMVEAAQQRDDVLEHVLLSGPPGLGKTTLANIISGATGTQLHTTSGPQIEKAGDLAGVLTNVQKGDILFIDEIHRLHPAVEEYLYPAMEDFRLDIIIDSGPSARSIQLSLPKFTLVGATTRAGMLTSPLRSRFGLINRLDYYTREQLSVIIVRSAGLLDISIKPEGAKEIASRSRGTPRIANNLLRWVRDFAQVRGDGIIDGDTKYIELPIPELYDLTRDPAESINLAATEPERLAEFRRALAPLRAIDPGSTPTPEDVETMERLRSLGYLSGSSIISRMRLISLPRPPISS